MRDISLFQMDLGLPPLWQVSASEFNLDTKRLDLRLDFPKDNTFTCTDCQSAGLKAYDTIGKFYRQLNFFPHQADLTAKVPRIKCELG